MTREEHLSWCKERALALADAGQTSDAFASMKSDLNKHPDTKDHPGIMLGMTMLIGGHLSTITDMRRFIEGFN